MLSLKGLWLARTMIGHPIKLPLLHWPISLCISLYAKIKTFIFRRLTPGTTDLIQLNFLPYDPLMYRFPLSRGWACLVMLLTAREISSNQLTKQLSPDYFAPAVFSTFVNISWTTDSSVFFPIRTCTNSTSSGVICAFTSTANVLALAFVSATVAG